MKFKDIGKFESDFLEERLKRILQVEYSIKSGNCDEDIAVETFILSFFEALK